MFQPCRSGLSIYSLSCHGRHFMDSFAATSASQRRSNGSVGPSARAHPLSRACAALFGVGPAPTSPRCEQRPECGLESGSLLASSHTWTSYSGASNIVPERVAAGLPNTTCSARVECQVPMSLWPGSSG